MLIDRPDIGRRRFLSDVALTTSGLAATGFVLSGCSLGTDLLTPQITIDASRPYRPVNASQAAAAISAYRQQNGAGSLSIDGHLADVAATYARHMAEADRMSHALPPYGTLDQRLRTAGYGYLAAGENLGVGYRDFEDAFQGWKNSPAHDRGMKDPDYTVMGIASVYDPSKNWKTFWCLMFAKPRRPDDLRVGAARAKPVPGGSSGGGFGLGLSFMGWKL